MCDLSCERVVARGSRLARHQHCMRYMRHDDLRLALARGVFRCGTEDSSASAATAASPFSIASSKSGGGTFVSLPATPQCARESMSRLLRSRGPPYRTSDRRAHACSTRHQFPRPQVGWWAPTIRSQPDRQAKYATSSRHANSHSGFVPRFLAVSGSSGSHQECDQARRQTSAHQQHPVAEIESEKAAT